VEARPASFRIGSLPLDRHASLWVELEHALLHAQVYQVGVYLAAGFQPQVQADLYSSFDQGLDDGL
jgi:hypothetical protein